MKMRDLITIVEGVKLPLRKGSMRQMRERYGAFVVTMRPIDFLRLTTEDQSGIDDISSHEFAKNVASYRDGSDPRYNKEQYNAPFLRVSYPSGRVQGHEGRHRAAMIMREGGEVFSCMIIFDSEYEYHLAATMFNYADDSETEHEVSFKSYEEREAEAKRMKAVNDEMGDIYYSHATKSETGGSRMKGSPRSKGWEYDAWKPSDMPAELIGEFNPEIRVATSSMRIGMVKRKDWTRR